MNTCHTPRLLTACAFTHHILPNNEPSSTRADTRKPGQKHNATNLCKKYEQNEKSEGSGGGKGEPSFPWRCRSLLKLGAPKISLFFCTGCMLWLLVMRTVLQYCRLY